MCRHSVIVSASLHHRYGLSLAVRATFASTTPGQREYSDTVTFAHGRMESKITHVIENLEASSDSNGCLSQANRNGLDSLGALLKELIPYINDNSVSEKSPLSSFVALQDSFQYNLTASLLNVYKVSAPGSPGSENHILKANTLLQGLLLLHPASRKLFSRRENMNLILSPLRKANNPSINLSISLISTLVHILLKNLGNFRMFEKCGGCTTVIEHLNLLALEQQNEQQHQRISDGSASPATQHDDDNPISNSTTLSFHTAMSNETIKLRASQQQDLNFKLIEFLIFYLVDEKEVNFDDDTSASKLSIGSKTDLFRDQFPEIDSLVENLNELKNV
ncbi:hypothetical protein CLIB1423_18S01728 [[Candida] railenensis]|uniref:Uncharacterized protein n=1 Tax=[Candida] railenensis TaxID=45579 RepID=A0A9P0QTK0_9ASCO|nr:hypothetical protein CLIB1423_18S01728 [[Candida] railenensis]